MDSSYQRIRQLYLEKLTGTISEEDDVRLQDLLRKDAQARLVWETLEEEGRELQADFVLARTDPERELEEWRERIPEADESVKPHRWRQWYSVAAVAAGLGIGYFFWEVLQTGSLRNEQEVAAAQGPSDAGVQLVFGDGKSVVFAKDSTQQFSIEGLQLESAGNQLLYEGNGVQTSGLNTLIVPVREDYGITLSDGTRVSLNSGSTLRFPFHFTGDTREVYIEGEAYFEVAKDGRRPFIVHTGLADIQVTGTSFNVNTYEEGIVRTSLVEGRVSVRTPDKKPLDLMPGLEAVYAAQKGFMTQPFDPGEVLSWREGICYFHHRKLGELTGLIERWYGVDVVFERKDLAQHTVSGLLEKGQLSEFLHDLRATSGIDYLLKDNILYLK